MSISTRLPVSQVAQYIGQGIKGDLYKEIYTEIRKISDKAVEDAAKKIIASLSTKIEGYYNMSDNTNVLHLSINKEEINWEEKE